MSSTRTDGRRTGVLPTDAEMLADNLADWLLAFGAPQVTLLTARRRMAALLDSLPLTTREMLLLRYRNLLPERPSEIDEDLRSAADPTIRLP